MKSFKIILSMLMIITLTACVGQNQLNVDEFLKVYNEISMQELEGSSSTVTQSGTDYIYNFLKNGILICLYSGSDGIIKQCTVTSESNSEDNFHTECINIIEAFTGFSADASESFFENETDKDNFHIVLQDSDVGKTMILNKSGNELNTNDLPTLKRQVNEDEITRPTLSETAS